MLQTPFNSLRKLSIGIALVFVLGCGRKETDPGAAVKDLVEADLAALSHLKPESLYQYDESSHHRFSEIFGGTHGENVLHFIQDRVKYFLTESDISGVVPGSIHTSWQRMPAAEKGVALLATNIGTTLWLQGLIDRTSPVIHLSSGKTIAITSSRVGVILMGPGYKPDSDSENAAGIRMNSIYRQAVLVHEARHSDCTGGITEPDLQVFRAASAYEHAVPLTHSKVSASRSSFA